MRKKKKKRGGEDEMSASVAEKGLRLVFMEELMGRVRRRDDVAAVSDVLYDMIAAGITPGPRSFHALVVSHVLHHDQPGAVSYLPSFILFFIIIISHHFINYPSAILFNSILDARP